MWVHYVFLLPPLYVSLNDIWLEKQKGDDSMKVHPVHPQHFLLLFDISDFDIWVGKQEGDYSSVSFPITIGHTTNAWVHNVSS